MTDRRRILFILIATIVAQAWTAGDVSGQSAAFFRIARGEQQKAQGHLRECVRIAERTIKILQSWQSPEDLKRAEKVVTDSYVQLNEARDATQRAGGALQRAQNLTMPDPMSGHVIGIIDKGRESMRGAHQAIAEAAVFENGRLTHIANALVNIQRAIQYAQTAADLAIF
jgi:hypothetical protein